MADIPAMTAPSGTLSATTIYDAATGGYFAPDNPATSLEILNGGCERANYGGGTASLLAYMTQYGTFACGSYLGFDEWTFVYAMQLGNDTAGSPAGQNQEFRSVHCMLCVDTFLIWNATRIFYWFQFFGIQDATEWDSNGPQVSGPAEYWDYRFFIDETEVQAQYGRLPYSRTSLGSPDGVAEAYVDPGDSAENRWRFHTRLGMVKSGAALNKGQHQLKISWWARIGSADPKNAKVIIPTGGLGLLALR